VPSPPTRDKVQQFVIDTLVDCGVERESLRVDATFDELELDSLDLLDLGESVNKEFRVKLRPKDLDEVKTVGEALDIVYAAVGAR
jgi:acyl carrier protein